MIINGNSPSDNYWMRSDNYRHPMIMVGLEKYCKKKERNSYLHDISTHEIGDSSETKDPTSSGPGYLLAGSTLPNDAHSRSLVGRDDIGVATMFGDDGLNGGTGCADMLIIKAGKHVLQELRVPSDMVIDVCDD